MLVLWEEIIQLLDNLGILKKTFYTAFLYSKIMPHPIIVKNYTLSLAAILSEYNGNACPKLAHEDVDMSCYGIYPFSFKMIDSHCLYASKTDPYSS